MAPGYTPADGDRARMANPNSTAIIYVITNTTNGKQYVGQTWRGLEVRWRTHCEAARLTKPSKMPIVLAIRKYGVEAFTCDLYRELPSDSTQAEVDACEQFAIMHFNTLIPRGYNLRLGGSSGKNHPTTRAKISASRKALHLHHSEEHKQKLSRMMTGRPVTWGAKISIALKGRAFGAAVKGRPKSKEHAAKIGAARRGRKNSPEATAKTSAALRGRKLSTAHREAISDGLRRSGANKGRVFTKEWKAKLSTSRRTRAAEGRDPQRCKKSGRWIRKAA